MNTIGKINSQNKSKVISQSLLKLKIKTILINKIQEKGQETVITCLTFFKTMFNIPTIWNKYYPKKQTMITNPKNPSQNSTTTNNIYDLWILVQPCQMKERNQCLTFHSKTRGIWDMIPRGSIVSLQTTKKISNLRI